jgi:glycosyltransferase involved in cell wall biosynthesis
MAGIGRYSRCLIGGIIEEGGGHEYRLLVPRGAATEQWPANYSPVPLPFSDYWMTILWQRLRVPLWADMFTGSLDVFYSPDFVLPPVRSAKTLVTVHDLSFLRQPGWYVRGLQSYLETAVPRSVRRADLILADSNCTRDDLIDLLGVPRERVRVLYPGVERRFRPIADASVLDAMRRRYRLPDCFLLSVGTLQPRKNYERLVEAFARVGRETRRDIHLVIVGDKGWMYDGIYQEVVDRGLETQVRLLGFVDDDHLPALYNLADVFVFPSLYEGFGIPPLEAMACGTPVVASNAASLPEVVGNAGLMVDPLDPESIATAILSVLTDYDMRADLIRRGLAQASQFTWQAAAGVLLDEFERLGQPARP